ncbi:MAG: ATP-binding protein, partial [Planctomycetaceae bacterium]|nr:ATP-binding protein [Planctomycetaceae bacterium]
MLTKITFQNLRCFEDFTLDRMTPLTLISGKNNVGKTSILEGVFLLLAYRKADVFININSFRGIDVVSPLPPGLILGQEPPHLWETLFRNLDTKQKLTISIEDDNKRLRTLCMEKDEQFSQTSFTERNAVPPMFQPLSGSYALKFMYEDGADSNETGRFLVTQSGLTLMFDTPSYLPVLPFVIYISPNTHLSQQIVATWTGEIEYKNKKNELVKMLRLLFDEIEDIFVMQQHGTANIFSRLQNGHPLPIRAMGDGINKLLHYLAV